MNAVTILYYILIFIAAFSAVCVLIFRNILYASLSLIACLLAIAGIYALLQAEFLAVTQIVIYAGGVLILIIVGIMLTLKNAGKPLEVSNQYLFIGILTGLIFFALMVYSFETINLDKSTISQDMDSHVTSIGVLLMSDYAIPFEVTGILLLISLIGAAVAASFRKT